MPRRRTTSLISFKKHQTCHATGRRRNLAEHLQNQWYKSYWSCLPHHHLSKWPNRTLLARPQPPKPELRTFKKRKKPPPPTYAYTFKAKPQRASRFPCNTLLFWGLFLLVAMGFGQGGQGGRRGTRNTNKTTRAASALHGLLLAENAKLFIIMRQNNADKYIIIFGNAQKQPVCSKTFNNTK